VEFKEFQVEIAMNDRLEGQKLQFNIFEKILTIGAALDLFSVVGGEMKLFTSIWAIKMPYLCV
jgi:hypothetical protein